MTAPMCIAGGIALQLLAKKGISVHAEYTEIGGKSEPKEIEQALSRAAEEKDSLGGIVSCRVSGFRPEWAVPVRRLRRCHRLLDICHPGGQRH